MSTHNNQQPSEYHSGNKFYILHDFNSELRKGIIIPLTDKIEELAQQKNATLDIYINSHGGDGDLCMHIIHLLELAKSKGITVRTFVMQNAYSAGSIVAMAGSKGQRYVSSTAEHCVHYGTQYGWSEKTPLQIDRNTDKKKRWFNQLLALYKKYATIPDLEEHMKDDSFFISAAQCIKWGLADKYLEDLS